MEGYLGELEIHELKGTPFDGYISKDWALEYIERYGQIDGDHHKLWVLDQVTRILLGTKVKVKLAKWSNGQQEYRITTDKPSKKYLKWVEAMLGDGEYEYDEGVAP